METKKSKPATTSEYIAQCPKAVQPVLRKLRAVIKKAAPQAEEKIGYGMPGFYQNGALVWFAAHTSHIGLYPTGEGMTAFKKEFAGYTTSKGAVQFPLDKPIPYALVRKVVKHRLKQTAKK